MKTAANSLLSLKEKLNKNLSGSQIAQILDDLLYAAIQPIVLNTDFFDRSMTELMPMLFNNIRRKYSNLERQEFADSLFSFLMATDRAVKFKTLRSCRLERTILFSLLDEFYLATNNYIELYNKLFVVNDPEARSGLYVELNKIEQSVGACKHGMLYSVIQTSTHCFTLAHTFKGMIIEKYIRLAYNESIKAIAQTKLTIDANDLCKNLLLSVSKAIDKYDPEQGALTSYVKWWFMDGINQSKNSHEYGNVFSMPAGQRKKMLANNMSLLNLAASIDECEDLADPALVETDSLMIVEQQDEILRRILRFADPSGMAMLALGIQYTLSPEEQQLLRNSIH